VLQEAQAMGLPVVATFHNGFPESLLDGESGFLVPERNVEALAEKVEYLIENSQLWATMGKKGRAFVAENFDVNVLNKKLEQIYYQQLYEQ
jgi:colanic acid/amylovoran biosynthesis glycosyltransferase